MYTIQFSALHYQRETAILMKWLWFSFQMIAALPAVIPEAGLSWIQVGTVNISEFICRIQLPLEKRVDSVIDSLCRTRWEAITGLLEKGSQSFSSCVGKRTQVGLWYCYCGQKKIREAVFSSVMIPQVK